jgi:hypothetical protein
MHSRISPVRKSLLRPATPQVVSSHIIHNVRAAEAGVIWVILLVLLLLLLKLVDEGGARRTFWRTLGGAPSRVGPLYTFEGVLIG